MTTQIHTVVFPGFYTCLASIAEVSRLAAQEAGLDDKNCYCVEAAVDEACSNIIEHAYGGEGIGEIIFCWQVDDRSLTITLEDHGNPFNPASIPDPKINAPLKERMGHGLGMFFMRKYMDEVHYVQLPDTGNLLTLVKYRNKKNAAC